MGQGDSKAQTGMAAALACAVCAYKTYQWHKEQQMLSHGEKAEDTITEEALAHGPPVGSGGEGASADGEGPQCHMIILALDYKGTSCPLTCTMDGDNMTRLAQQCGVTDIVKLYDNEAHKEAVLAAIEEVGERCEPGDYFIFNYSGHGANVPDKDGDEEDGQDEALCLVTEDGKLNWSRFLTDDEFAKAVTDAVDSDVNILIMCDCCHSGTIGDFSSACWEDYRAISMSGCQDDQTSGDTGKGGIWTHALLRAIQEMKTQGKGIYSVGQLYNVQLDMDEKLFHSEQDIELKWTTGLSGGEDMVWPLIPNGNYRAPWQR